MRNFSHAPAVAEHFRRIGKKLFYFYRWHVDEVLRLLLLLLLYGLVNAFDVILICSVRRAVALRKRSTICFFLHARSRCCRCGFAKWQMFDRDLWITWQFIELRSSNYIALHFVSIDVDRISCAAAQWLKFFLLTISSYSRGASKETTSA